MSLPSSVVLLLLCAAWAVPSSLQAASPPGASLCQMGLNDREVPDRCFPPSRIAQAEGMMSVKPVRPVASAERLTHLPLTQVEIRNPGRPIGLNYLFGRIPLDDRGRPDFTSRAGRYAIVGEVVGLSSLTGPQLFRHRNPFGGTAYIDWNANFRCRNLSLDITSNLRGKVVASLGEAILNDEVCGK